MASDQVLGEVHSRSEAWDAAGYDQSHAFAWKSGSGILKWLAPQAGETILDVGCGTGHLTAQIARAGARAVGLDSSREMLLRAREKHAEYDSILWVEADARDFSLATLGLSEPLDAIFSNATLHWLRPPEAFLRCASECLKPGGRLAAEFGGRGNVERVLSSIEAGLRAVGINHGVRENYFPSLGEYAALCESHGLQVLRAELFDRPTPLEGPHGLRDWARMFRPGAVEAVPEGKRSAFLAAMEDAARSELWRDGVWTADYRRLRILAVKA